jgi:hypothetical protein
VEVWISYNPNEKPNKKFYGSWLNNSKVYT